MSMQAAGAEVPVLIAGGGLVGLSTAMFLAQHGIPSLAIERLRGGSPLPRAAHFHMRTLEMFRIAGIEEEVRRQSEKEFLPEGAIVAMDSLAGRKLADIIPSLNEGVDALSPCRRLFVSQPGLEPILRRRAGRPAPQVLEGRRSSASRRMPTASRVTVQDVDSGADSASARQISGRRRRRPQQGARAARHSVRRPRRVLQQHHDLFPRRPRAAAAAASR